MRACTVLAAAVLVTVGRAHDNGVGLTPALGWNSWVNYQCNVSEALMKSQAQAMVSLGLNEHGFEYMIIDDCWSEMQRDPATQELVADKAKFPSGMKALADYMHSLGLKLGIYSDVGTETCKGHPGSFGYFETDANTFASWGIDYLKLDTSVELSRSNDTLTLTCCRCHLTANETKDPSPEYAQMSAALNATGRPILFSICNWGKHDTWTWAPAIANSWRTTQDLYPNYQRLLEILDATAPLAQYAKPGGVNDPDMLEVGIDGSVFNWNGFPETNLTQREARSHFGLWTMFAAPLILGFDMAAAAAVAGGAVRSVDDDAPPGNSTNGTWASELVANAEVLAINQDALVHQARRVSVNQKGSWPCLFSSCIHTEVWSKNLTGGRVAVLLFNRADEITQFSSHYTAETITATWAALGLGADAGYSVRDALRREDKGMAVGEWNATVEAHGSELYVLTPRAT
jgi:alpha-galactosidase